jgi:hypothetical protein
MTRLLLIVGGMVLALAVGTATPAGDKTSAKGSEEKSGPGDNQPPEGFKLLFNGKDLDGWQGLIPINQRAKMTPDQREKAQKKANEKILAHWTVKNGVMHYDGKADSLQTVKDYGNIEMWVDWKITKNGDSGIYLRGNPQVQIWDNKEGSGGLYNNQKHPSKPLAFADNPPGEWNRFYIKMVGDKLTVKLNGKLVVDNVPLENYWQRGAALPEVGPIELQHHHTPLWFKNIYIKELP